MENAGNSVPRHQAEKGSGENKVTEELRQTRQELELRLAQLQAILDSLSEGLVVSDLEGRLFYWNPVALAMHGFTSLEECRRQLPEFADTFELSTAEEGILPVDRWPLSRILNGETLHDWQVNIRRPVTEWQRVFSYGGTLARDKNGQPLLAIVTVSDITDRKRNEAALREAREKLNFALDSAQLGTISINVATGEVSWDERSRILFGLPAGEQLPYEEAIKLIHPDDRQRVDLQVRSTLDRRSDDNFDTEYRTIMPDGSIRWIITKGRVYYEGEGEQRRPARISGVHLDATRFKQLEEELENYRRRLEEIVARRTAEFAEANRKLQREIAEHKKSDAGLLLRAAILDNAGEAIFLLNSSFDFVYANEAASEVYRYGRDEFLSMNLRQLLRPQDATLIESRRQEVIKQGQLEFETVHVRKDGSLISVQVRLRRAKTLHGEFVISVVREMPTPGTPV